MEKELTELQTWVNTTIQGITDSKNKGQLQAIWSNAAEKLNNIKSGIDGAKNKITVATQRKAIATVRKAIRAMPDTARSKNIKYWALDQTNTDKGIKNGIVVIGIEKAAKHKAKKEKSLIKALENDKTITGEQFSQLTKICADWLNSYDYTQVSIAIALFTGRRASEVLSTAQFTPVRGNAGMVNFSGQNKKKGEGESFEIPVLFDRTKVIKATKALRALKNFEGQTLEQIEHATNRQLSEQLYKLFNKIGWDNETREMSKGGGRVVTVPHVKFHDLRKIYVAKVLGGKSNRLAVQKLLGHDNLDTGKHYENWKIID